MTTDSPSEARERALDVMARAIFRREIEQANEGEGDFLLWEETTENDREQTYQKAMSALAALLACEGTGKRPALIEELAGERWKQTAWAKNMGDTYGWSVCTYNDLDPDGNRYHPDHTEPLYRRIPPLAPQETK